MRRPETLVGRLLHVAQVDPDRCCAVGGGGGTSYAAFAERVVSTADRLRADGIATDRAGDARDRIVGIACGDDVEHLVLCLAAAHLGVSSCTVPTHESREQRRAALEQVGASAVLGAGGSVEWTTPAPSPPSTLPSSPPSPVSGADGAGATLLFSTSGTTGEPKIVCQRESALVAQAPRHVRSGERFACLASVEHNFAKRHRLYALAEGATNVFLDARSEDLVDRCRRLELTTLHVSAFQARELLAVPGIGALRGLRLKIGGSHVSRSLREQLRRAITDDLECGYGTTETGAIAFSDPTERDAGDDVGRALPGIEIRIVGEDASEMPVGEVGEIAIRSDGLSAGYLGDRERTAERFADGCFRTGDIGRLDEQGRLFLVGRSDDMFVFNSVNIHPQDIEAQIREFAGVRDAVVVPQRSAVHGDVPVALVVFDEREPDIVGLKRFMRERAGIRCPKRFTAVERVPRNAAGKIVRSEARSLVSPPRRS